MFTKDDICPHLPTLAYRARNLRRSRDDAKDLLQRTVLQTLEMLERITTDLGRWMLRVMYRLHQNWGRRGGGKRGVYSYDARFIPYEEADYEALFDPESARAEDVVDLDRIITQVERLPLDLQYPLVEIVILGRDYPELARELNVSVRTLKKRVAAARVALRNSRAGFLFAA